MASEWWSALKPKALKVIHGHVLSNPDVEVGGFIVGTHADEDQPPVCIAAIEARHAEGDLTRLKFTHEAWEDVHKVLDTEHPGCSIVGWYHSHPGHGIFLSQHDRFIHRHLFPAPWQIAVVVDPVHRTEGLFAWVGDEPELLCERELGTRVATSQRPVRKPFTRETHESVGAERERVVIAPEERSAAPTTADVAVETTSGEASDSAGTAEPRAAGPKTGVFTAGEPAANAEFENTNIGRVVLRSPPSLPALASPPLAEEPDTAPPDAGVSVEASTALGGQTQLNVPTRDDEVQQATGDRVRYLGHLLAVTSGFVIGFLVAIAV